MTGPEGTERAFWRAIAAEAGARIRGRAWIAVVGLLIGTVLLVWIIGSADLGAVWAHLGGLRATTLVLAAAVTAGSVVMRAIRWGIILRPVARPPQAALQSMTWIGSAAITLLPARGGEIVRPVHLSRRTGIPLMDAFASLVVERLLDALNLGLLVAVALWWIPGPRWMGLSGVVAVGLVLGLVGIVAMDQRGWWGGLRLEHLPDLLTRFLRRALAAVARYAGPHPGRRWTLLLSLSILQWLPGVLLVYILSRDFPFQLSLIQAAVVMVIILAGLALPAPPAFLGNYQFFAALGLGIVGVGGDIALSFGLALYAVQMLVILVGGGVFLLLEVFGRSRRWIYNGAGAEFAPSNQILVHEGGEVRVQDSCDIDFHWREGL